jgi:hypothetical protein
MGKRRGQTTHHASSFQSIGSRWSCFLVRMTLSRRASMSSGRGNTCPWTSMSPICAPSLLMCAPLSTTTKRRRTSSSSVRPPSTSAPGTLPTVHRWQHATPAEQIPLNRTLENARAYSVAAKQLAGELDVPFVDLCHDMLAAPEWQLMLNDGLHLSESGAAFLAPRVQAAINSLAHGAFASEKMRPQLPLHSELTSENWREKLAGVIPGSWVK